VATELGVIVDASTSYGRGALRGVSQFIRDQPRWSVSHVAPQLVRWDRPLDAQVVDYAGLIIQSPVHKLPLSPLADLRIPAGCISAHGETPGLPTVRPDHRAIGAMAAHYFLQLGFRHLAYVGTADEPYSVLRQGGFAVAAATAGVKSAVLWLHPAIWGKPLASWLKERSKPLGLLASDDSCARDMAHYCHWASLMVPEQIALLGVDDDPEACEMDLPHLSSVMTDSPRIGYEAMRVLTGMLTHGKRPTRPMLVPPITVTVRQSTDTVPTTDELVQRAVRLLRDRCSTLESPAAVAQLLGGSRDALESRLVAALGRGLAAEMRRVRVECAKHLLRTTDLALADIARKSGFASSASFARDFRQEAGLAPSDFRLKARGQLQARGKRP